MLLGRWAVRLLAAPEYYAAHEALPWVALGWALYGLFLVFVSIAGRAKVTTRTFPAAAAGLVVNVVRARRARRAAGHQRRGHRAVRGVPGDARVHPPAHPARLRRALRGRCRCCASSPCWPSGSVAGELLLPTAGFAGLALRALWAVGLALALVPDALRLRRALVAA